MMTVDESLQCAETFRQTESVPRILASEVRRLRDEVNGLTGSLDRAENALQNLMSYLSVNGCWAEVDADEAEKRIRDGIDMLVRPAVERAERAEAQLKEAREQTPVKYLYRVTDCFGHDVLRDDPRDATIIETIPLFAAPIPAPAVPDWNVNIERIRDVMHMLGISIEESVECFSAALPTNINRMTLAMKRHLQELAGMTAATAPSVPEGWREVMAELAADLQSACDAEHPHRDQYPSIMRKYNNDMKIVEKARALLQSAEAAK